MRSAMYSSESGFDASLCDVARRRTASFVICTSSPRSASHSWRDGRRMTVFFMSFVAFGISRGSYAASCTGGQLKRRAIIMRR